MKSIVIFGAGIAGLSAAHELSRIGYNLRVVEATDSPGGFFKSGRLDRNRMPTEYSWHGMGPYPGFMPSERTPVPNLFLRRAYPYPSSCVAY
jgi:uncharacterized protein with NAD-binding domain and iron-sulfur cluster